MENHLHPLLDRDREEDARRIVATLPPLIVSAPPAPIRQQPVSWLCIVLRKIGRDIDRSEAAVLHDLGVAISKRLRAQIRRERTAKKRVATLSRLVGRRSLAPVQLVERPPVKAYVPMSLPTVSLSPRRHRRH